MKILWITNSPLPEVYSEIKGKPSVTSGWVNSAAKMLIEYAPEIKLGVASFYKGNTLKQFHLKGTEHYLIPDKVRKNIEDSRNDQFWKEIKEDFNPDLTHIHGTEYPHSFLYVRACGSKNVVVSIQGLVSVCEKYYFGNIRRSDLIKSTTVRDLARLDTIFSQYKNMRKRGYYERKLIESVNHVIGRTSWDRAHTWAINPEANYHFCNETLRPSFYKKKWSIDKCDKYSIFISQAQYPLKGFHQLLKALPFVLRHYPETKVYVAGYNFFRGRGIRINGYGKYINSLIKDYNLSEHISFTGLLSEEEMCQRFLDSHVFVCPSAIENSPNSVGEAQLLGVPCVASYVGGTADMVFHEESGLLYRFEEVEMLASNICAVFSNQELAKKISEKSQVAASKRHDKTANANKLISVYNQVVSQKNKRENH